MNHCEDVFSRHFRLKNIKKTDLAFTCYFVSPAKFWRISRQESSRPESGRSNLKADERLYFEVTGYKNYRGNVRSKEAGQLRTLE